MKQRPCQLTEQFAILSPKMARRARVGMLDWTFKRTSEACTIWRQTRYLPDKGLDYRTIVKIENGQLVDERIVLHLRKTYEEAGVIFTEDDVSDHTQEQRSLRINGFTPIDGHIHQSVDIRLKQFLANAETSISAAELMSRIVEQGLNIVTSPASRT